MPDENLLSDQVLKAVFDAAVDAVILMNGSGIILDSNPSAAAMFGYEADDLKGQNVSVLMPSPHRDLHDGYLSRHLETGRTRIIGIGREVEAVHRDGSIIPVELSVSRVDVSNQVIFAGILRDVSERRHITQSLEARENELRAIINTAVDAIIVIDRYGLIRLFNPAAEGMFGYTVHEVLGRNVKVLMPSPYKDEHDQYLQAYHRSGNPQIIGKAREVVGRKKSGDTFPIHLSVSKANTDNELHYVGIVHDLSDQKRLQLALVNEQEKERKRIGEDLHDVLAQDLTALTLLGRTLQAEIAKSSAAHLTTKAEQLVELARSALDESRALAQGLFPTALEQQGLVACLREWCGRAAQKGRAEIVFESSVETVADTTIETDLQLYRICQEAVRNAIKHSGADKIRVTISQDSELLELHVSDDGHGFNLEAEGGGMGSHTMRHRASIVGAEFSVQSSSTGTDIRCRILRAHSNLI